ncbi:MAG: hypothetical protein ABIU05_25290, partial [Nitrospirales bacterium]
KGMAHSNRAVRDANSEGIKVKFSQRGSKVMGIIRNAKIAYFQFIHVAFSSMQQLAISCHINFQIISQGVGVY